LAATGTRSSTTWPSGLDLPEETTEVIEGLRSFLHVEVDPRFAKLEDVLMDPMLTFGRDGRYVPEVMAARNEIRLAASQAGYYTLFVPEELGGGGMGAVTLYAVWEDLYHHHGMRGFPLFYDTVSHWATGPSQLFLHAADELRAGALQKLMSGEHTICFALSETDAGSDLWGMRTTAVRDGDGWRIRGTKQWMTNGPYADYALTFAVTDPSQVAARKGGITAFLVPVETPGYQVAGLIKLYGHHGSNEAIVAFDDCHVADTYRLGEVGDGLRIALSGTTLGRVYNAARAVGMARWALEQGIKYSLSRETFGKPIFEYQAIAFPLAEAATEVLAAHLMGLHTARLVEQGKPALKEAAMMKNYSVATAVKAIDRVVQTFGGIGITNESLLSLAWQELRAVLIADGSAEMLNRLIAGRLAKGDIEL
jgi:alkylation response protein AidB-like acyl-CoA dehydrogenase